MTGHRTIRELAELAKRDGVLLDPHEVLEALERRRSPVEVQGNPTDGEHIEIGPECFANRKRTFICWQGQNYYSAPAGVRFRLVRLLGVGQ